MKYLHLFDTDTQRTQYEGGGEYLEPYVSLVTSDDTVHYNKHNYAEDYLTFVAKADGTFTFTTGTGTANSLSYSLDDGATWVALESGTASPTIKSGSRILWKGECTPGQYNGMGRFTSTAQFDVEGNVMSLLYGDDFVGQTSLEGRNYAIGSLFAINTNVVSAENLSLPATTLADYCYSGMFYNCTNLTIAPELPATTLADSCYNGMFNGCTSLTTAPSVLPAMTLANYCYQSMFYGCTSLTIAPQLPATTLANYCYCNMFQGCTGLTASPELPATTLVDSCYQTMFSGCTNLNKVICLATDISTGGCTGGWLVNVAASGTFKCPASMASVWSSGVSGIPSGWTVQDAS